MIKKKLLEIIQNKRWNKEIKMVELRGASLLLASELKTPILFIVPHADDELISSFSLLKSLGRNAIIYYCGMTGSNTQEDNKLIRDAEIINFCRDNDYLFICPNNWQDELLQTIDEYGVNTIFFPSYIDWHNEHRYISNVLVQNKHSFPVDINLFWYSVSVPISCSCSLVKKMSKAEQKDKYYCFKKYYKSQNNIPINRFIIQEKINAKELNEYAGEVFINVSWDILEKSLKIEEDRLISLRNYINSIRDIREQSKIIYEELFDL